MATRQFCSHFPRLSRLGGSPRQGLQNIPALCVAHIDHQFRLQRVGVNGRPLHDRMMIDDQIKDRVPVLCIVLQLTGQGLGLPFLRSYRAVFTGAPEPDSTLPTLPTGRRSRRALGFRLYARTGPVTRQVVYSGQLRGQPWPCRYRPGPGRGPAARGPFDPLGDGVELAVPRCQHTVVNTDVRQVDDRRFFKSSAISVSRSRTRISERARHGAHRCRRRLCANPDSGDHRADRHASTCCPKR